MKIIAAAALAVLATPAVAEQTARAPNPRPPSAAAATPPSSAPQAAVAASPGVSGLVDGMPVRSSDNVEVAEVAHLYGKAAYGANDTFFVLAPMQLLRRIYGREAYVENGVLRLRMTAAQFRQRSQNPPDWINGNPPRR